jgi:ribosomal protein L31
MLKRSLTLVASGSILAAALVNPAFAAPADFVGTWVNTNSSTRGITRVVVTSAGSGKLNVQVFGKCHPTDCDWGKTTLVTYGSNVQDTNHRFATANYSKNFANTLLTVNLNSNQQISLQSFTQFTDSSARQNYSNTETFKR